MMTGTWDNPTPLARDWIGTADRTISPAVRVGGRLERFTFPEGCPVTVSDEAKVALAGERIRWERVG